jgi:dTDP-4-amino-4,6-dideoxygalactose transaminase
MHVALVTLGIGAGDEVITTPMTFAATANVIEHVGATPVLVDVEPDTLNIDPENIERAITSRTKVILPVHYAGHPVDLDAITSLAAKHGLTVLEDAAHAVAARYRGRLIGSGTNPVAFSFYATKNLTTGEGGMLTGPTEFLDRARVISLHGMSRDAWRRYDQGASWYYSVLAPGYKYNMTDVQAAMGMVQLGRLDAMQRRRREIAAAYNDAFADHPALQLPAERDEVEHAWQLYVLRLRTDELLLTRNDFIREMHERNVGTSVHFIPIHYHEYYRDRYSYKPGDFPVAEESFERMVSLPVHPALTDDDVSYVISAVLEIGERFAA